ncbi:MAG: sarcosine oxidase subunit gamma family protein [Gammaproteobacteria bacterium]
MADLPVLQSPLAYCKQLSRSSATPADASVKLGERALLGQVNLRGDPSDAGLIQSLASIFGVEWPVQPNTASEGGGGVICWLGPDEWLIQVAQGEEGEVIAELRAALGGRHAAVVDVSSGFVVITLGGRRARDVLAKGCSLDLHLKAFRHGQCAQTLLAKAGVLLRPCADGTMEITVRRSFAEYLWMWLEDAAWEYGLAVL